MQWAKGMKAMKRKCVAVLAALMLAYAAPSWSNDAASALVNCDELKAAARQAKEKYIAAHTPRVQDSEQRMREARSAASKAGR